MTTRCIRIRRMWRSSRWLWWLPAESKFKTSVWFIWVTWDRIKVIVILNHIIHQKLGMVQIPDWFRASLPLTADSTSPDWSLEELRPVTSPASAWSIFELWKIVWEKKTNQHLQYSCTGFLGEKGLFIQCIWWSKGEGHLVVFLQGHFELWCIVQGPFETKSLFCWQIICSLKLCQACHYCGSMMIPCWELHSVSTFFLGVTNLGLRNFISNSWCQKIGRCETRRFGGLHEGLFFKRKRGQWRKMDWYTTSVSHSKK